MNPELAAWVAQWNTLAGTARDIAALYLAAAVAVPVLAWRLVRREEKR